MSLGHRPRNSNHIVNDALKARFGTEMSRAFSAGALRFINPGTLPQAGDERRALGAKQIPVGKSPFVEDEHEHE